MPSTPPSWVKLAARAASVSTGLVELEADQAPGPQRDVRRVVAVDRHADHGRGGVVRAHGDDLEAGRAYGLAHLGHQGTDRRPGSTRSANSGAASPSRATSSSSQAPVRDVEQAGRRGVGALGDLVPGQPGGEQVGHEQQPVGVGGASIGGELVDAC